jgi:hypothetical protein
VISDYQNFEMNDEERLAAELARMDRAMKAGVTRPVFGKSAQPTPLPVQQNPVLSAPKSSGTMWILYSSCCANCVNGFLTC